MILALKNLLQISLILIGLFAFLFIVAFIYNKMNKKEDKEFTLKKFIRDTWSYFVVMATIFGVITFTTGMALPDLLGIYIPSEGEPTKREMQSAYELGNEYFSQGFYENAIIEFEKVNEYYSKYDDAKIKLAESKSKYRNKLLAEADGYIEKNDFIAAKNIIESGIRILQDDPELLVKKTSYESFFYDYIDSQVKDMLEKKDFLGSLDIYNDAKPFFTEEKYLEIISSRVNDIYLDYILYETKDFIDKGDILGAINYLKSKRGLVNNFQVIDDQLSDLSAKYTDVILQEAQNYADENDFLGAIDYLKSKSSIGNIEMITEQINILNLQYIEYVTNQAQSAFKDQGYEEAISILTNAKKFVGENASINQSINDYKEYEPSRIWDWDYFTISKDYTKFFTEQMDNYKNVHYNVISSYDWGIIPESVAEKDFLLDGKYQKIEGTIFRTYERRDSSTSPWIEIYCDDRLVYEKSIDVGDKPSSFSIDLLDVRVLRIKFSTLYTYFDNTAIVGGVSDLLIYKK